ncbi:hypothetical protein Clacol_009609 [Clathrus columnatus]|uniref:Uncharacterized protein n=1 Tax=Clathrus columnatus TaxID=1419009 RepID=A0AAV5APA3_9AGAM|nr:hypothetical protein Clacol_009609 [Clathrus columnatus]
MAEIPTSGILINNAAYPGQYLNITANKDGEILIGYRYPNKSESVNEIERPLPKLRMWLLNESLGGAAYNLVGFKDEKDLDSPMNVYFGQADASLEVTLILCNFMTPIPMSQKLKLIY